MLFFGWTGEGTQLSHASSQLFGESPAAAARLFKAMAGSLSPAAAMRFTRFFYFQSFPPIILGLIFVSLTRDFLFKYRVLDFNTPEALHYANGCSATEARFRTYNGSCNWVQNETLTGMGMKDHRFGRSALWTDGKSDPGLWEPSPYLVAEKLLKSQTGARSVASGYSLFMTSWINLQIHDWLFHNFSDEDPYKLQWGPNPNDTFLLRRTVFDSEGHAVNIETPWWDASQIFGTTEERAVSLRVDGTKCELRVDADGLMPLGADGLPEGGMIRNWWAGLEAITLLFIKEHNYLCRQLRKEYTAFSEEELFQTSRLIIAAQNARIHTIEWTPALLNNSVMNVSMHSNWEGIQKAFLDHAMLEFKNASWLPKDIINFVTKQVEKGIPYTRGVGHATQLEGVPYSLSEDFVSSYRMHPLLPDLYEIDGDAVAAEQMINKHARDVMKKYGMSKILDAFGHQAPTTLTMHNYPDFLTKVDIPGEDGPRNMAVVDILRDRERGMVRYNQARRQYGLKALADFEDISDDKEVVKAIKSVYKSVEDIDYMVGCFAESPRPKGYVISDTAFYVFIMNASRRLLCDRFYQESYNADTYTKFGFDHVENTTFKSLLLRHYPELEDSIGSVPGGNAFFAWQGTPKYGGLASNVSLEDTSRGALDEL
ncbi:hypothetical protein WJX81_006931 [Elliptochloris bilobata]|uniref:Peroxidase n=1 Tax=Elliptochloris bilobata TaxID=381761 RepID=A0AAW1R2T6_9CHLO